MSNEQITALPIRKREALRVEANRRHHQATVLYLAWVLAGRPTEGAVAVIEEVEASWVEVLRFSRRDDCPYWKWGCNVAPPYMDGGPGYAPGEQITREGWLRRHLLPS